MVHGYKRHPEGECRRLGEVYADEEGSDKAGSVGHGDGVYIAFFKPRLRYSGVSEAGYYGYVVSRGDLRHDAAVDSVHIGLAQHLVRKRLPPVANDGDSGLVARGFNS